MQKIKQLITFLNTIVLKSDGIAVKLPPILFSKQSNEWKEDDQFIVFDVMDILVEGTERLDGGITHICKKANINIKFYGVEEETTTLFTAILETPACRKWLNDNVCYITLPQSSVQANFVNPSYGLWPRYLTTLLFLYTDTIQLTDATPDIEFVETDIYTNN